LGTTVTDNSAQLSFQSVSLIIPQKAELVAVPESLAYLQLIHFQALLRLDGIVTPRKIRLTSPVEHLSPSAPVTVTEYQLYRLSHLQESNSFS
jgi:hypothetical protein